LTSRLPFQRSLPISTYRFLVTAKPEGTFTTYSGWFFFLERKEWGLIASFRTPKDGIFFARPVFLQRKIQ
jgi:hypothetical protein